MAADASAPRARAARRAAALLGAALLARALAPSPVRAQHADTRAPTHPPRHVPASTPLTPLTPASLCTSGAFRFLYAGTPVGEEHFEITCRPDGTLEGHGHTQLALGAPADVETTIALTSALVATRVTAKGSAGGAPIEQTLTLRDGTATVVANGATSTVPYTPGASYLGSNIYYTIPPIVARYDAAKGGEQRVPAFPALEIALRYGGRDVIAAGDTAPSATFDRYDMRVAGQHVAVWFDDHGHAAAIAVAAQRFIAIREDLAPYAGALLAARENQPAPGAPAAPAAATPDYSAPPGASYTAEEVVIPHAGYQLAGTLLAPRGRHAPAPAVLLITGSGLQTRDETIPIPGLERYRPFREIAETLAARGIAVLRVDDRGTGASTGRETLADATTSSFADDARAEVAFLRAHAGIDPARIALLGHSEGAAIAAMLASTDPRIAAIALMAGAGRPGWEISTQQVDYLADSDPALTPEQREQRKAAQRAAVQAILEGKSVPGVAVNAWTREFFATDPLAAIRKVRQPMLVLQGALDRQVSADNAARIADAARASGNRDVTVRVFPALNHLFLPAKTGSFAEYGSLETQTLPRDVLATISDWLAARLGRGH